MGRIAKYNWEELLKEYLASEYQNKTDFAKAKGINPSLLRRNTTDWPNKSAGETKPKGQKVSKKNNSNVTKKESNTKTQKNINRVAEKDNKNVTQKKSRKVSENSRVVIKDFLDKPIEQLTEKELLFCFRFAHSLNATQSYMKAYECSYASAHANAFRLMAKDSIKAEIQRLKEIKYQSLMINIDDIVEKRMRIAFSDITNFIEFGQVEKVIGTIKRKVINISTNQEEEIEFPLTNLVNGAQLKNSTEVDGSIVKSVKVDKDGGASIELHDPQKSMEWLERYFMWNPMDKHKVAFDKAKLRLEEEKVKVQQEELKLAQRKAGDDDEEETTDDGFIDALNAEAPSVWSDHNED